MGQKGWDCGQEVELLWRLTPVDRAQLCLLPAAHYPQYQ
jgi:hypothetical protein